MQICAFVNIIRHVFINISLFAAFSVSYSTNLIPIARMQPIYGFSDNWCNTNCAVSLLLLPCFMCASVLLYAIHVKSSMEEWLTSPNAESIAYKQSIISHYHTEPAIMVGKVSSLPRATGLRWPLSFKNRGHKHLNKFFQSISIAKIES